MIQQIFTIIGVLIAAVLLVAPIILLYFWWKMKRIKRGVPKDIIDKTLETQRIYKEVENVREKIREERKGRRAKEESIRDGEFDVEAGDTGQPDQTEVGEHSGIPIPEVDDDGSDEERDSESSNTVELHKPTDLWYE